MDGINKNDRVNGLQGPILPLFNLQQNLICNGAERMLRKMGLDPKYVDPAEIRADYEAMQARRATLERTYKSADKETKALQQKISNVLKFIEHNSSAKHSQQHKLR